MTASQLGEQHATFARLVGDWQGEGEVVPSAWGPGGPASGRWSFRLGQHGLHLIHDYVEDRADGGRFEGHGVLAVDPGTGDLLWFWFDSLGFPPLDPARGRWHGPALVLEKSTARGTGRTTFAVEGSGLVHSTWFRPPGADAFQPVAALTHRRLP